MGFGFGFTTTSILVGRTMIYTVQNGCPQMNERKGPHTKDFWGREPQELEPVDDGRYGWSWTCSLSKAKTANYALVEWHW